ncbi:hypothetical protein ElyMa_005092100 [Elysia marginata]|uniref:Uncharacterized protein n=1 Tax=Elysia marginata TaxID=1093978 RepID=A0AAV4JG75_9GAST|nr:hypothetical protein ElyMa_005092100 [Elysia marginata]
MDASLQSGGRTLPSTCKAPDKEDKQTVKTQKAGQFPRPLIPRRKKLLGLIALSHTPACQGPQDCFDSMKLHCHEESLYEYG